MNPKNRSRIVPPKRPPLWTGVVSVMGNSRQINKLKSVARRIVPLRLRKFVRKTVHVVHPSRQDRYRKLDESFLRQDIGRIQRATNLRLVPSDSIRGNTPYGEWCHEIGVFQALMCHYLSGRENAKIVDIGCGNGKFVPAAIPFVGDLGSYIGLDVQEKAIRRCRQLYPYRGVKFLHVPSRNPFYTPEQSQERVGYPLLDSSADLVTALSVWTHLGEPDSTFYFAEVDRILRPGGTAILTWFLLDDKYQSSLPRLRELNSNVAEIQPTEPGSLPGTLGVCGENEARPWIFDVRFPGSDHWYHPSWAEVPEHAVGVTKQGIQEVLVKSTSMVWLETYSGFWKGSEGLFFQDILVFTKR